MKTGKKAGICLLAVLAAVMGFPQTARADYVTGSSSYRQPVPDSYEVTKTVNNIGSYEDENRYFNNPQDLFVDKEDNVYIVDTGNQRVVKLNSNYETVAIFYGPDRAFKNPQGIYVGDDGDLYVADTDNSRIVHMDAAGNFVEEFGNPESGLVTSSTFKPTKLLVNQTGYLYAIRGENIMAIGGNGEFRGYYGQTDIGFDLGEVLTRMFASEEQQAFLTRRLASSYTNIAMGDDGMIYAASLDREEGEIKRLNSIGANTYRKYKTVAATIKNPITDFIEKKLFKSVVAGNSFKFGEYFDDDGMYMEPVFSDICVDHEGIVTVIEQQGGRVYQYDQDGNMLVAFGGVGESRGTFSRTSAIDVDSQGNLLILDKVNCNVQVFSPTEFILLVHQATASYSNGDYQAAYELWKQVLAINENYELAHTGMARAYYKEGRFKEAMDESRLSSNRDVYTQAFDEYKYEVLREKFVLILFLAAVILAAAVLVIRVFVKVSKKAYWNYLERKGQKMGIGQGLLYCSNILLHPIDTMEGIRYNRTRINMAVPVILFLTAYVVRIAYLYIIHFPLASIELWKVNVVLELAKLWIVPLTWIPASFAATSISGGESKLHEIAFASAISLVPYIVINVPIMFLSNIWSKTQAGWFGVFSALAYIGMFLILFLGMKIMNNYSVGKTLGMMFVSACMMLVIWLVLILAYILSGRLIQFVMQIMNEFRMNFL